MHSVGGLFLGKNKILIIVSIIVLILFLVLFWYLLAPKPVQMPPTSVDLNAYEEFVELSEKKVKLSELKDFLLKIEEKYTTGHSWTNNSEMWAITEIVKKGNNYKNSLASSTHNIGAKDKLSRSVDYFVWGNDGYICDINYTDYTYCSCDKVAKSYLLNTFKMDKITELIENGKEVLEENVKLITPGVRWNQEINLKGLVEITKSNLTVQAGRKCQEFFISFDTANIREKLNVEELWKRPKGILYIAPEVAPLTIIGHICLDTEYGIPLNMEITGTLNRNKVKVPDIKDLKAEDFEKMLKDYEIKHTYKVMSFKTIVTEEEVKRLPFCSEN